MGGGFESIRQRKGVLQVKTMYEVFLQHIEKVNIVGETSRFVTLENGQKRKKDGWLNYFDTFQEAKEHVIKSCRQNVERIEGQLKTAKASLEKAMSLTEYT